MMNKTITKRLSIALSIILLLFITFGICFAGNLGTTPVAAAEQATVANMTAYSSFAENQRLYAMTEDHIDVNMGSDLTIDSIKSLQDFDGNQYTLFELDPIGYIIYYNDSGKYIEYSESSYSPYLNLTGNLYYGGAMQYYREDGDVLIHTLKSDTTIDKTNIPVLSSYSHEMALALTENPDTHNLSYIGGGETHYAAPVIDGVVSTRAAVSANISMTSFFPNLRTSTQIGYRSGGVCGYIAGAMMIAYNYFAFDSGLITNSSYINSSAKTLNGPGLTNRLLELNGQDPDASSFDGTTGTSLMNIVGNYLDTVPNRHGWSYGWRILAIDATATLDQGYPVPLFGSLPQLTSSGNVNHAVVAYDYEKYGFLNLGTKYRVHYGWSGYSSVWLESPVIGTVMFMTISD